jgi:hypothetical protein
MDRITAIRLSLSAFTCGMVGLIPVIGFVPAIYALVLRGRIRTRYGRGWNPASRYLDVGAVLGGIGVTYSMIGLLVFIWQLFY